MRFFWVKKSTCHFRLTLIQNKEDSLWNSITLNPQDWLVENMYLNFSTSNIRVSPLWEPELLVTLGTELVMKCWIVQSSKITYITMWDYRAEHKEQPREVFIVRNKMYSSVRFWRLCHICYLSDTIPCGMAVIL